MTREELEHVLRASAAIAKETSLRERVAMLDDAKYPHAHLAWIDRRALEAKGTP
ncbi:MULTISPECIES: hypothetical protein [unclassified Variovorax]|jgi:hypothetical protein|uniref:hypothetical protein n=1 Tax=unclassified Variovorax TaxID=663243 RepID=UPI001BD52851|nr:MULTISPECIES: hypothetical protein [unclassified Variovorax]